MIKKIFILLQIQKMHKENLIFINVLDLEHSISNSDKSGAFGSHPVRPGLSISMFPWLYTIMEKDRFLQVTTHDFPTFLDQIPHLDLLFAPSQFYLCIFSNSGNLLFSSILCNPCIQSLK